MSDKNHLYLVDGSSYIFRAYHRLPPLTNPKGVPVGAVYGYTTMLWKLAKDLHDADGPTHLAVILDHSSQSFRNAIYDQYKANRPEPPEDLRPQFPLIRDATRAFSLPCIEMEGFEADDLIASYTEAAVAAGWDVTIVSSDKDLMQLIREPAEGPQVDMLDTMKNVRLGLEAVDEKFGVGPDLVGDVLALMGDSVDNVPGVRGVGPKTATKLIVEYGDLEKALAGAETMKASKLRDNLIEHADMARLSRILVELKRDVPLMDALDDLKLGSIPPLPLKTFLDEHGFRSLSAKLDLGATPGGPPTFPRANAAPVATPAGPSTPTLPAMPPIDRSAYECVTTVEALDRWIAEARAAHVVGVDTETASLDSVTGRLVGVSMATAPGRACYIPLGHGGTDMFAEKPDQIAVDVAIARLGALFADDAVLKVGHNLKYDIGVLAQHGVTVAPYDDTLVMSFALDAGKHQHGLDELAKLHLDHTCLTFKDMCGSGKSQISFAEVQLDRATEYAAEDADVALRLWKLLKLRLPVEGGTRVYEMVDRPLASIVEGMERAGIMVNRDYLAKLSGEFATEMLRIEGEIHALAGQPFRADAVILIAARRLVELKQVETKRRGQCFVAVDRQRRPVPQRRSRHALTLLDRVEIGRDTLECREIDRAAARRSERNHPVDRQGAAGDQLAPHDMPRALRRNGGIGTGDMLTIGELDGILRETGDRRRVARKGGSDSPGRAQSGRNSRIVGRGTAAAFARGAIDQPRLDPAVEIERPDMNARGDTRPARERNDTLDRDFEGAPFGELPP